MNAASAAKNNAVPARIALPAAQLTIEMKRTIGSVLSLYRDLGSASDGTRCGVTIRDPGHPAFKSETGLE
jgi:hypothetical protein